MDIKEHTQLESYDRLEFEEHEKGWDLLLRMIKSRTKENRAWHLVNRIKEVRRLYFNLIKKTNNMNQQIMTQTRSENRRKGRSAISTFSDQGENMSNMNLKVDDGASSDDSSEDNNDEAQGKPQIVN